MDDKTGKHMKGNKRGINRSRQQTNEKSVIGGEHSRDKLS